MLVSHPRCHRNRNHQAVNWRMYGKGPVTSLVVLAGWLLGLAIPCGAQTTESTEQYMQGLRDRQLHRLAIAYAEDALQQPELTSTQRVSLTIELMQTHADWARQLGGAERQAEYAAAHEVAKTFNESFADEPRAILVQVQDALIDLAAGRVLRMEREVGRADESSRQQALADLRSAIRKLESLDEAIEEAIPQAFREKEDTEALRGEQLLALRQRVRFQRGLALQNQALLFAPDDRLNRIDALSEVLREMGELVDTVPKENELWWRAQIERAESLRLLAQYDECSRLLNSLPKEPPRSSLNTAIQVQRTRLQLAQGNAEAALRSAVSWREKQQAADPELDLAILTSMLMLADQSPDGSDTQQKWQEQAVAMSRQIQTLHGPFWGRRASLELVGNSGQQPQIGNVDILLQLGDENYLKGQYDEALQAYQRAAEEANKNGGGDRQFDAARKAGLLQQQLKRYQAAAETLSAIALEFPDHELAAGTYLQAAWNLGQAAREDTGLLTEYVETLEQCLEQWPNSEAAEQARLWLGKIYEFQKRFTAAVDVYLGVPGDSPRYANAVALAQAAADQALSNNADDTQRTVVANTLASAFADRIPTDDREGWSDAEIQVGLEAARLMLLHGENRQRRAGEILRRLLEAAEFDDNEAVRSDPVRSDPIRSEIAALQLVESLQQAGNGSQSAEQLQQIANVPTDSLLQIAATLARLQDSQVAQQTSNGSRIAPMLTAIAAQLLDPNRQLTDEQQREVKRYQIAGWQATGQIDEAIAANRELLKSNPRSGDILESLASVLSQSKDKSDWEESLTRWRQLAQGSLPNSERWFRAKYHTAAMLDQLGRKDEAVRLLRFTKETPPGWDAAPNRDELEALLKRLQ